MGLHTIKKESVANQVFEQLKGQILNQSWLPGNKLHPKLNYHLFSE